MANLEQWSDQGTALESRQGKFCAGLRSYVASQHSSVALVAAVLLGDKGWVMLGFGDVGECWV
jgi:hypothetical protein